MAPFKFNMEIIATMPIVVSMQLTNAETAEDQMDILYNCADRVAKTREEARPYLSLVGAMHYKIRMMKDTACN